MMIRRYGLIKVSTGRKLFNGMVRNNWNVCEFSERDIAYFEAPLNIKPLGVRAANKRFIETCLNFRPDCILIGHSDLITNKTLSTIKQELPEVPIIYRNVDPPWRKRNVDMIHYRKDYVDAIFVTTAGDFLKQFVTGKNVVGFIPNATDPAIENMDNSSKKDFKYDLSFCGKGDKSDDRYSLIVNLDTKLKDKVKFESFGIYGNPPVWSAAYDNVLMNTKMALNLNRFEGWKYYSSARISQLMGNGILAFVWDDGDMRELLPDNTVAYFSNEQQLLDKILYYQNNDAARVQVASEGRRYYHEHFSGQKIVKFMIETALNMPYSEDYIWSSEVYR
jgi:hypothetical protein